MVDYIQKILGIKVVSREWEEVNNLPHYLRSNRRFVLLEICSVKCLAISYNSREFSLPTFQKQKSKLREFTDAQIILCLDQISSHQRSSLIEAQVAFVVPGNQMYLPFLGIALQEYYKKQPVPPDMLTAMAQYVFLYLLYNNKERLNRTEIAMTLNIAAINVTRAVQELTALGLVRDEKDGKYSYVSACGSGRELFEKAKHFLINPVQKKIHIVRPEEHTRFPYAGMSALSRSSMLSEPRKAVRAIGKAVLKSIDSNLIVDPKWNTIENYIELEVWKYDPVPFAVNGNVDTISLVLSLSDEKDERVEYELASLMENMTW